MPSPLLSAPGIDLDLEAFERIMAGDRLALMRIGARWLLEPGHPPPTPILVADTGDRQRRFHPLPQPAATIHWVHADARLWWAGYAVPADLVLAVRTRWTLEAPPGARFTLPEPDERSLLEISEPAGVVVRNGRPYLLVTCGLVAAALIPLPLAVGALGDGTLPLHPTGIVVPDPSQLTGVPDAVGATDARASTGTPTTAPDSGTPAPAATAPAPPPTETTPAPPTDTTTTPAPPTDTTTTPAPPPSTTPAPPPTTTTTTTPAPTVVDPIPPAPRPRRQAAHVHVTKTAPRFVAGKRGLDNGATGHATAPAQRTVEPPPQSVAVRATPRLTPSSVVPSLGALSPTTGSAVPDALLGGFQVPPFLLPIYQAAGTQYDVPWQVLAAINQVETDYGRDLAVSSAGAEGWMQFMPSTWRMYGVDANLDGRADPNNPVDAIFAAARYLEAAGAAQDLPQAIFAYNHADWYVQEVLTIAQRIQRLPGGLVDSITGLTEGRFPILGSGVGYGSAGAGDWQRASAALGGGATTATLRAPGGRAVVAAVDGRVVAMGRTRRGAFLVLQDAFGNRYTYGHLGSLVREYAVPTGTPAPTVAASDAVAFGDFGPPVKPPAAPGPGPVTDPEAPPGAPVETPGAAPSVQPAAFVGPVVDRSLRNVWLPATARSTHPARVSLGDPRPRIVRAAAPVRSGRGPVVSAADAVAFLGLGPAQRPSARSARAPLSPAVARSALDQAARSIGVDPSTLVLRDLRPGAPVVAGTVLGHLAGTATRHGRSAMILRVHTAGPAAPAVDPVPLLDGWRLERRSAVLSASWPLGAPRRHPSIGSLLLLDRGDLARAVLADRRVRLSPAAAADVRARRVDRRVLGVLELLAGSGLRPSVDTLVSGYDRVPVSGGPSAHAAGTAVDIVAIDGHSLRGRQGPGSLGERTLRRLLSLQGALRPDQVIAQRRLPGLPGSVALPGHTDHIAITFRPGGDGSKATARAASLLLGAGGWNAVALPGLGGLSAPDPADAPTIVRAAIGGAQAISGLPYVWGGGHGGWVDSGYDCSGAVSYVLHAAGLLDTPLVSGDLMSYGLPGPGRWITIYANPSHTFMRIGDAYYGTSGFAHPGTTGPAWFSVQPPPGYLAGFVVRHPAGL